MIFARVRNRSVSFIPVTFELIDLHVDLDFTDLDHLHFPQVTAMSTRTARVTPVTIAPAGKTHPRPDYSARKVTSAPRARCCPSCARTERTSSAKGATPATSVRRAISVTRAWVGFLFTLSMEIFLSWNKYLGNH